MYECLQKKMNELFLPPKYFPLKQETQNIYFFLRIWKSPDFDGLSADFVRLSGFSQIFKEIIFFLPKSLTYFLKEKKLPKKFKFIVLSLNPFLRLKINTVFLFCHES